MSRDSDSEVRKTDRQLIEEIAARSRRTETRVTKIAEKVGVDAGGEKPALNGYGELRIPSRHTSLNDIMQALPEGHTGRTDVYCGTDFIVTLHV